MNEILSKNLKTLISEVDDPIAVAMGSIYEKYKELFNEDYGAIHHSWKGGVADYMAELLRINSTLYDSLLTVRDSLPFTRSESVAVLFFYNVEKLFKFKAEVSCGRTNVIDSLQKEFGFSLSGNVISAIRDVNYTSTPQPGQGHYMTEPLPALAISCINLSRGLWPNEGKGLA